MIATNDPDPNGDLYAARMLASLREATAPLPDIEWWYLAEGERADLYQLIDRTAGERVGWFLGKAKVVAWAKQAGLTDWQAKTPDGLLVFWHEPRHDDPCRQERAAAHDESVNIAKRLFG